MGSRVWFAARASGLVAYMLLWLSVIWGVMASSRPFGRKVSAAVQLDIHRLLTTAALTFGAVHGLVLTLDDYVHFGLADVFVPFLSGYRPVGTGLGVLAFELGLAISISFRFRGRMGAKTWRMLHYSSYIVFAMAFVHALAAGTDASHPVVLSAALATLLATVYATTFRILTAGPTRRREAAQAAQAAQPAVAVAAVEARSS